MIGKTISRYRILEKLGEGGMGVVYKAEDTKLGRAVALKFLPPELTRDADAKERFIQEARALSALDHPNICTIHEIDETMEGQTFIAMACYDGETLKTGIEHGPLKLDEVLEIATQIAQGLAKAHGQGIIHRDVKPANILVTKNGLVKIVDFGLAKLAGAKLTRTGKTLGTAQYMSPEQVRGEEVDQRADIFSLGAIIYEMLTGTHAFPGEYEQAAPYAILNANPEPVTALRSGIPMELERIVPAIAAAAFIVAVGVLILRPVLFHRAGPIDSIAVLPLENLSGDSAQEYFADGMTEALITDLAKIGALRVISRTSVMRFKGTKESLPRIARELNVDAVIEGSVLLIGDRVRITAQLIEASTDRHIWAESYERDLRDVLSLQQEVARAIAVAIEVALTPAETMTLTKATQVNPKVHDLYLRGRYRWNKRTAEDLEKSIEFFKSAIAMAPRFALAYAGTADAYLVIANWGYRDPREMYALAKQHAERALEIDDQLSQVYADLAGVEEFLNFNSQEAERLFKRAIELNPNNGTAHQWYAEFLSYEGRQEEAVTEIDKALAIDPLSLIISQEKAAVLLQAKRYDEAIAQCRRTLDLDKEFRSVHMIAAYCYLQRAQYPEYVAEFQEAIAINENGRRGADEAGRVFRQAGIKGLQRWMIETIDEFSNQPYNNPYYKAQLYAFLGDKDKSIEWMQKAIEVRSASVVGWRIEPSFDAIRDDPRFRALIREAGLEQ